VTRGVRGCESRSSVDGEEEAGTFVGKQATMERMRRMAKKGIVWDFDIHDVLANDDHVVVLTDATLTKGVAVTHGQQVQVMHVRDGKMTFSGP
jgi:hypothetical protein